MATDELRPAFRRRLRGTTQRMWALQVARGLGRTVAVAAIAVAALAGLDYALELGDPARAALAALTLAGVGLLAARWVIRPAVAWDRGRVAVTLEELFPRLGQRLRTATEHGPRPVAELARDGVSPGLVAALEAETAEQVRPLPLHAALPIRPALAAIMMALVGLACAVAPGFSSREWRTALIRVALIPAPYTTLTASASADVVDEGAEIEIRATVEGRARPAVVLSVRDLGETAWREETMDATDDGAFAARLSRLKSTAEFFVSAGPERTPVQRIVVRHALKIVSASAEVASPAYTGVPVVRHDGGSFSAVRGSTAAIKIEFDRPPVVATLVVTDPAKLKAPPRRVAVTVVDRTVSADLALTDDMEYAVEARDADGMPAAPHRYRVRVVADQPPAVWFDSPSEGMEVHTLAEVLMRVRARDDFGVTKLGVTFQVNNEEEKTLVVSDIAPPHQREAVAEQVLMLEQFLLTQKDCVAYYAFAEDNLEGAPHRTTTDLRFIDIRPFRRTYAVFESPEEMGGGGGDLILLDEVIARQRFNLNQSMRLEGRAKVRLDLAAVERIAAFENKLATQTHDLADFLIGLGVDGAAILSQAEEAMLSTVDSLNGAKFTTAVGQERDALRFLMEARNTLQIAFPKLSKPARAQARAFDRLQRQKLRRDAEKAEMLPQIADELAKLADEESDISRMLAGAPAPGGEGDPARDRQEEVAGKSAALDKLAATAKGLTGLARSRIAEATKGANAAADALGKGDRVGAKAEIDKAAATFRAASKQVAALAAAEAAQQLAAARDLANDIAQQAAPADTEPNAPGLSGAAEAAKTLKDVLENLAASGAAADADAAKQATGLLKSEDLAAAIARLEKPGAGADAEERKDLAERFAALGQRLDQAQREAVAPRLEALAKLEREVDELERKAADADDADWRRLREQAAQLVEKFDAAGVGGAVPETLRAAVRAGAVGNDADAFRLGLNAAHANLVAKLQEFVAQDRLATGNEAVPPAYKELVERYLRALSAGGAK